MRLRIWGLPRLVPNILHLTQDPVSALISVSSTHQTEFLELLSWTEVGGGQAGRGSGNLPGSFSAARDRGPFPQCREQSISESVVSERPVLMEPGLPPKPQKGVGEGIVT